MKAAKLEIGIRSQEPGARRKESEGRRKKCFCKYEMLPVQSAISRLLKFLFAQADLVFVAPDFSLRNLMKFIEFQFTQADLVCVTPDLSRAFNELD
ncbi:hypothetical protein [Microcoleus sp. B5-D4]|uniref:hypothetical protein n=1 Tax=Microcoleus sp. B5-D4 TaxID=2818681 RepID=UPI002FD64D2A